MMATQEMTLGWRSLAGETRRQGSLTSDGGAAWASLLAPVWRLLPASSNPTPDTKPSGSFCCTPWCKLNTRLCLNMKRINEQLINIRQRPTSTSGSTRGLRSCTTIHSICPSASTNPGTTGIWCLTLVLGSLPSTSSVQQKHPKHDIYNPKLWCFLRYQTAARTEGHFIHINLAGVTLLLPTLLAPQARPGLHYELPLLSGQNLNFLFRCKYFKSRTDCFLFLRAIFTLFFVISA